MSNNEIDEIINRLNFENIIWIVFIVVSVLDIYGDELIKKSLLLNDKSLDKKAKDIFLSLIIISVLIYFYFLFRNYKDYKKNNNTEYEARFIGSLLIFIGTLCLLYFQLSTRVTTESLSEV